MNIAVIDARNVYAMYNNGERLTRRLFVKDLDLFFVKPEMQKKIEKKICADSYKNTRETSFRNPRRGRGFIGVTKGQRGLLLSLWTSTKQEHSTILRKLCPVDVPHYENLFRRVILQYNRERQTDPSVQVIFATVAEAYDVLSDPFRRAVFDQYGEEGLKRGMPGPEGFIQPYVFHGDPMRTFRDFFGTDNPFPNLLDALLKPVPTYKLPGGAQGFREKDAPLVRPLLLTLHEIFHGGVKKLKINRLELTGKNSTTTEMKEKVLSVPIQPGIPSGTQITFPEEGDQGPTIIPADVIFITEERPHERFKREGDNLVMHCNVSLTEALGGIRVVVKTLDERTFYVNITDVVHPDYEKIIEGEGMPLLENPTKRGDLIIRFKVDFPKYLPRASKKLLQEAWQTATNENKEESDQVYKMVMLDKMKRMSKREDKLL